MNTEQQNSTLKRDVKPPTHRHWKVTNIKIKMECTKSAVNLRGKKTHRVWNNFYIPFQELRSKKWWNWSQTSILQARYIAISPEVFKTRTSIFLTKNNLICHLHKIFFQDGWLEKQIRIKWLSSVNQLWQSSTYHQFSWEVPVKFPSLRNCIPHGRKVAKAKVVIDVLSTIIFHYFHPCLTCLSSLLFTVIQSTQKPSLPSPRQRSWGKQDLPAEYQGEKSQ